MIKTRAFPQKKIQSEAGFAIVNSGIKSKMKSQTTGVKQSTY
jgi:hypothetical protein